MFTRPVNGPYLAPVNKVKAEYIFCIAAMILFYEVCTTVQQKLIRRCLKVTVLQQLEKNHHIQSVVPFRQVTSWHPILKEFLCLLSKSQPPAHYQPT